MERMELIQTAREYGIFGKSFHQGSLWERLLQPASILIINCAECEPLNRRDSLLLAHFAREICKTGSIISEALGVSEFFIGINESREKAVRCVQSEIDAFPNAGVILLKDLYPEGDEIELVFDCLGILVSPGKKPIDYGIIVMGIETVLRFYQAIFNKAPVTSSFLSIIGEVETPVCCNVPFGTNIMELLEQKVRITADHPAILVGGVLFNRLTNGYEPVTENTGCILILEESHPLVQRMKVPLNIKLKRAMASCSQCESCTRLCPRYLLGYPVEPHKLMRAVSNSVTAELEPFLNSRFCSSCGLCEYSSCPQGLSPVSMMFEFKKKLQITKELPVSEHQIAVRDERIDRRISGKKFSQKLGLSRYEKEIRLETNPFHPSKVKLALDRNREVRFIAEPQEVVSCGQQIAFTIADSKSFPVFATVNGVISEIDASGIIIQTQEE